MMDLLCLNALFLCSGQHNLPFCQADQPKMLLLGLELLSVPKQQICISWRSKEKCFSHHLLACLIKVKDRRKQTAADSPLCKRFDILLSFQKYICKWNLKKGLIREKENKFQQCIIPSKHHSESQKNGHIIETINLILDSYSMMRLTITAGFQKQAQTGEDHQVNNMDFYFFLKKISAS